MAGKTKTDYNDILCQAIDTIVSKRIEDLGYDKTIICTITNDSDSSNGHYVVNNGSTSFDAYSEDTGYKKNDSVYVTVPKGDFTQQKIIISKYTANNGTDPIAYISPLENIYLVSGNLVTGTSLRNNSILANGRLEREYVETDPLTGQTIHYIPPGRYRLIWEQDLTTNSDSAILNNAVFDTLAVKAKFKCGLGSLYNMKSGHYGLIFELFSVVNPDATPIEYRISRFDFNCNEFFGNPYMFLSYIEQEKYFGINALGNIAKINVYLYQSSDFKYRGNADITDSVVPTPAASADPNDPGGQNLIIRENKGLLNNIFVEDLEVYFGMDLTRVADNTFSIYTSGTSTFNANKDDDYNTKTIMPVWFNKTEQGEYIGFSDGVYDFLESTTEPIGKAYTEDDYMTLAAYYNSAMRLDQQQLIDKGIPAVKELLFIYAYALQVQQKLELLSTKASVNINRCYMKLQQDLRAYQTSAQRNATNGEYLTVIEDVGAYATLLKYLDIIKGDENTTGSWDNSTISSFIKTVTDSLIQFGMVYTGEINISSISHVQDTDTQEVPEVMMDLVDQITNIRTYLNNTKTSGLAYFNNVQSYVDDDVMAIWTNWKTSLETVFQDCEDILTSIEEILQRANPGSSASTAEELKYWGTLLYQYKSVYAKFDAGDFDDFETEHQLFVNSYANRYCIYYYRYVDNYFSENERFMPKGWQRLDSLTNLGLPDGYTEADNGDLMYESRAKDSAFTYTIGDPSLKQERIQAILIYNHQIFKSNILTFYNEEPVVDDTTKDAVSGLYIQLTDEILGNSFDEEGNPVVVQKDTYNSKETYQLYDVTNTLVNRAEAYKKRKIRARYKSLTKGDDYLKKNCVIYWFVPLNSTMLTYSREDLIAAGFSVYEPGYLRGTDALEEAKRSLRRVDYLTDQDYQDAIANLEANFTGDLYPVPPEPYGNNYREGYMMAYRDITTTQSGELDVSSTEFIYQIKQYYVPTFTNNTIYCKVVKQKQSFETSQLFTFASLGTNGTDYSLTITPATNQAAVKNNEALQLQVKLFDHNGDQIFTTPIDVDLMDQAYNGTGSSPAAPVIVGGAAPNILVSRLQAGSQYGYSVLKATATVDLSYETDGQIASNDPILNNAGTALSENNNSTDTAARKTRTVTLESYYPIPWSAGNYYIEGASTIVYDSLGQHPSYYTDPFVLYRMDTNERVANQSWSIKCYPNNKKKTTLISSYMPWIKKVTNTNNIPDEYYLQVSNMYLADNDYVCSAVCTVNNQIVYVQPIQIIKNRFSSPMLNAWDGELTIDKKNGTILASMVGAGKKESDNTFSGVLMGEVAAKTEDNSTSVGMYGYNHGEQSFGFRDDGTAFLGKAGRGRIEFDGNEGRIQSASYKDATDDSSKTGMMIDLDDAWIDMRGAYVLEESQQSDRWSYDVPNTQNNNEVNRTSSTDNSDYGETLPNLTKYKSSGSQVKISVTDPFFSIKTPAVYYYTDSYAISADASKIAAYKSFWESISYYGKLMPWQTGYDQADQIAYIIDYLNCTYDIYNAEKYRNTDYTLGNTTSDSRKSPTDFLLAIVGQPSNGYFKVNQAVKSNKIAESALGDYLIDWAELGITIAANEHVNENGVVATDTQQYDTVMYNGDYLYCYMDNNATTLARNEHLKIKYITKDEASLLDIVHYPTKLIDAGQVEFVKADGTKITSVKLRANSGNGSTTLVSLGTSVEDIATKIVTSLTPSVAANAATGYDDRYCAKFLSIADFVRCIDVYENGDGKESKEILHVGINKYFLQTDNFKSGTAAQNYQDGEGLKFDLKRGSLEAYNFTLFAANPHPQNNGANYVKISSSGNPYIQVVNDDVKLLNITTDKFILQSQNWLDGSAGTQIDVAAGKITSYNFKLVAYDKSAENSYIKFASGGNPYLQIKYQGIDLLNIGHDKYIMQSSNWSSSNKTGIQFDLKNGKFIGYDFYLRMARSGNVSQAAGTSSDNLSATDQAGMIVIDSSNETIPFIIKSTGSTSKFFKIFWDGSIVATAGLIGGWRINNNSIWTNGTSNGLPTDSSTRLSSVDFNRGLTGFTQAAYPNNSQINSNNEVTTLRVAIGNKFGIAKDGTLYAKDGYFRGNVYADSGTFNGSIYANYIEANTGGTVGGWVIGATSLSKNGVGMASSGNNNKVFYAGSNFYVTNAGYIYAAAGGQIGNWDLTTSGSLVSHGTTEGSTGGSGVLSGGTIKGGKILGGTLDIGPSTSIPNVGEGKFSVKSNGSFTAGGGTFSVSVDGALDINSNFKVNASGDVEKMGGINVQVKEIERLVVAGQNLSNSEYFVTIGATSPNADHWPKLTYQTSVLSYFNDADWVWGIVHESKDVDSPVIGYVQYYKVNSTKGTSTVISGLAGTGYANNAFCSGISLKSLRSIDTIKVFSDTATVTHGGGTNGCFAKGTKIMISPFVYKNIEDIKEGETVLTYNTLFHTFESTNVIICNTYKNKQVYEIQLEDYSTIYTSSCHPFLDINNEWCAIDKDAAFRDHNIIAKTLTDKTILQQYKKNMKIKSIRKTNRIETLYDIGVNSYSHTYIANDCIVHNVFTPVQVVKT